MVGFQSRTNPLGGPHAAAWHPHAVLKAGPDHAANVVCVWTSDTPAGVPLNYFPPRSSVYLLAAWQMHAVANLARYHLTLRWDVYRGYFGNVSLIPTKQYHLQRKSANVPGSPIVGTFRLTFAPKVDGLRRGWYSLVGRVFLLGPQCPKSGCVGQVRQSRFWMY